MIGVKVLKPWRKWQKHATWHEVFKPMHISVYPWAGYISFFLIVFLFSILAPEDARLLLASVGGAIGGFVMAQFQYRAAIPLMKEWLECKMPIK